MGTKLAPGELEKFNAAAGVIATSWSQMEDFIEGTLWRLVKLKPKYGRTLTTHIGFVSQLDTIKILLEDKYPDKFDREEWVEITKRIHKLRMERNSIVHARWNDSLKMDKGPALVAYEYKGKTSLKSTVVICSLEYMQKVGGDINTLKTDYLFYLHNSFGLAPSLYERALQQPRTSPPQDQKTLVRRFQR